MLWLQFNITPGVKSVHSLTENRHQPFFFPSFFAHYGFILDFCRQHSTSKPNVFSHHGKSRSNSCKTMGTTIIRFSSNTTYDPSYTVNLQTLLSNDPLPLDSRQPVQTYQGEAKRTGARELLSSNGQKVAIKAWSDRRRNVAWLHQQPLFSFWRRILLSLVKMETVWKVISDKTIKWAQKSEQLSQDSVQAVQTIESWFIFPPFWRLSTILG